MRRVRPRFTAAVPRISGSASSRAATRSTPAPDNVPSRSRAVSLTSRSAACASRASHRTMSFSGGRDMGLLRRSEQVAGDQPLNQDLLVVLHGMHDVIRFPGDLGFAVRRDDIAYLLRCQDPELPF